MNLLKEFKDGVYLKPNGNLAIKYSFEKEGKLKVYVDEGKSKRVALKGGIKVMLPIVIEGNNHKIGWGPCAFLNKSEYLGEL